MNEAFYLLFLIFAVFVWPVLIFRRMRKVRSILADRAAQQRAAQPRITPYVDEMRDANGEVLARPFQFDADLAAADKKAQELPDIERTLLGKR